ncbi:MAG: AraC family transcriptional regulator [Pseudanabaenales cyanobacterium]|nr:AraC family transcriptional regulator [Pseudanabaenales cyanobacterium]
MQLIAEPIAKQELIQFSAQADRTLFKLIFVEAGQGWLQIGQRKVQAASGDLFLIAPKESHHLEGLKNTLRWIVAFGSDSLVPGRADPDLCLILPAQLRWLSFVNSKEIETGRFQIPLAERPRWLTRLQQLKYELSAQPLGYAEVARSLLTLILFDLARLAQLRLSQYSHQSISLLIQVFRFIEANYHQPISLSDVARAVDRSPAYLTELIRRETGKTVLNWITEYRMASARRLLMESDRTVDQIAELVGYFDRRHFGRQFLRRHNTTPRAWRLANQAV